MHVFGDQGSVEAVGETQTVLRLRGGRTEVREFPKIDSLRAEFDAFADAVAGRSPYSVTPAEMVDTIAAFEAVIRSIESGKPVRLDARGAR